MPDDVNPPSPSPAGARPARGGLPPGVSSGALWEVAGKHGVVRMRLVGVWARGEASPGDPVEIVAGYQRRPSAMDTVRLRMAFEEVTGVRFVVREESTVTGPERDQLRKDARLL
jgi:predicted nucleotidyltransferase